MTTQQLEDALNFKVVTTARGCEIHDDPDECEMPIQAAHIIPKQALRSRGLYDQFWDTRNGIGACYRAHRRSDAALARFPIERFRPEFWQFADELDLRWYAERLYGVES